MRNTYTHSILFLFFGFIYFQEISSQSLITRNVIEYTNREGFTGNNIHKIIKDSYGFMWLATQDGLFRFEGKEFILYNKGLQTKRNLLSPDVRDLVYDTAQQMLWVINNQAGINGIDITTGIVKYSVPYSNVSLANSWRICALQHNNTIIIGTNEGIEIFDLLTHQFLPPDNQLFRLCNSHQINDIRCMTKDENGNVWLGVMDKGFYVIDVNRYKIIQSVNVSTITGDKSPVSFWPTCCLYADNNTFFAGTKKGLFAWQYDHNYNITQAKPSINLSYLQNEEIKHVALWKDEVFISGNSLYTLDNLSKKISVLQPDKTDVQHSFKNITFIYHDTFNIWLGCREGMLAMKRAEPFLLAVHTNKLNDVKAGLVFSVVALSRKESLIGTQNGLYKLTEGKVAKSLSNKVLMQAIFRLPNKEIMLSGSSGLQIYLDDKIYPVDKIYPEFAKYVTWQCNSAALLNDSIIVLATESNQGLLIWNFKRKSVINYNDKQSNSSHTIASNTVNKVFKLVNGEVVVLYDYAMQIIHNNATVSKPIHIINKATGKPYSVLMDIQETKNNYWLAVYGEGLLKVNKRFELIDIISTKDGLSNNGVYKIFNYSDKNLFITSNQGITVYTIANRTCHAFYEKDGLQNNTFEEASGDTSEGLLYAGGINGYTIINPAKFTLNSTQPVAYFTGIVTESQKKVNDTSGFGLKEISIASNVLQTTLNFGAINWFSPGRVVYAWRIVENNSVWTNIGNQNFINLIGIQPGTYHFQIKTANENGIWSLPKELVLHFEPRWYQTLWFKIVLLCLVCIILYSLYAYRIRQIKKEHDIRKNIATDLHDDLGGTLNSVKIFTNLAISGIQQQENLLQIKDNLNEATMGLRDMIWVLDDSLDTVDELLNRLQHFALPLTHANQIDFKIDAAFQARQHILKKEEKRNLYLLIKEAINNSIKYSNTRQLLLTIEKLNKHLHIIIKDSGKGFDNKEITYGYGLKNMLYRAQQINYNVSIHSEPGMGTTIEVEQQ